MRAYNRASLLAILEIQRMLLPWVKWLQRTFSPRNRPFICYLALLGLGYEMVRGFGAAHATIAGWWKPTILAASTHLLMARLPAAAGLWGLGLGSFFLFWLITSPVELRRYRWLRIGVSMVLLYLALSGLQKGLDLTFVKNGQNVAGFFGFLVPAAVLAGLWTPALAWCIATAFTILMETREEPEPELTLKPAYQAAAAGEPRRALRLIRPMLRANFHHYEALVLAACLHRKLHQHRRAQLALLRALDNSELLDGQRRRLLRMMAHQNERTQDSWEIPGLMLGFK